MAAGISVTDRAAARIKELLTAETVKGRGSESKSLGGAAPDFNIK